MRRFSRVTSLRILHNCETRQAGSNYSLNRLQEAASTRALVVGSEQVQDSQSANYIDNAVENRGAPRGLVTLMQLIQERAQTATSINDNSNQRRRRKSRDDCAKARRARNASMAYSTRCDAFRVKKCMPASWPSLISGKSQSSKGRTNREEFSDENSPVEANEIKAIQSKRGP